MNQKAPPFKLYRRSANSLVEQAVGGMKSAIASEFYQIGEKVLSLNDFSRCFRVSLKVPRMAYARLVTVVTWLAVQRLTLVKLSVLLPHNPSVNLVRN
jgi:DNA-binding FadR family transcriptional regulator